MSAVQRLARGALRLALVAAALVMSSCSEGEGSGEVTTERLLARNCFDGAYSLKPTFFGSNPYRNTQTIRIQRTDEQIDNADGLQILVSDTDRVRASLGHAMRVGLPPAVVPPGVPIQGDPDPPVVQMTLYLHETCHGENIALYGMAGSITFTHLFSGDRNESDADDRLTEATFDDIQIADPRDQPPEGGPVPDDRITHLKGKFRFYFERGQPAQPFP